MASFNNTKGTTQTKFQVGLNGPILARNGSDLELQTPGGSTTIDSLNVAGYLFPDPSEATPGQCLTFDGDNLTFADVEASTSLVNLTDVSITSPINNQILQYNGSSWVNAENNPFPTLTANAGKVLTVNDNNDGIEWTNPLTSPAFTGFSGCMVTLTEQSNVNYAGPGTPIPFDIEIYDYGGWHDDVTDNTRMTVPAGVTRVRLTANVRLSNITSGEVYSLFFSKNGSFANGAYGQANNNVNSTAVRLQLISPILEVEPGDYFTVSLQVTADTTVNINNAGTWFAIEKVQGNFITSSDVTNALSYTPVDKAGDTMSGQLSVNNNIISNTVARFYGQSNDAYVRSTATGGLLYLGGNDTNIVKISGTAGTGNQWIAPSTSDISCGNATDKWSEVFATNGTVNTSDERLKTFRKGNLLTSEELAAAREVSQLIKVYQWNDAIEAKGENNARLHFGVPAQSVWNIFAKYGLVQPIEAGKRPDSKYSFLCYDEWEEMIEFGENGETISVREAGNRFSVRYDELMIFLVGAQEQRLSVIENLISNL